MQSMEQTFHKEKSREGNSLPAVCQQPGAGHGLPEHNHPDGHISRGSGVRLPEKNVLVATQGTSVTPSWGDRSKLQHKNTTCSSGNGLVAVNR